MHLISDHLRLIDSVGIGGFILVEYLERSVSVLSYFLIVFFMSLNLISLSYLRFMHSLDIGDYLIVGYLERSDLTFSYFSTWSFLVCKLYISGLQVTCLILDHSGFMDRVDYGDQVT